MKFLYFTDCHIRGTNPKSRQDDYFQAVQNKLIEIGEIASKNHVDYILNGGDIFDRPDVSVSVVNRIAPILQAYPAPIYAISGNHDIYGHNPVTLNRTMFGLLDALGIIQNINNQRILLEKEDVCIQLSGSPYIYGIDREENRYLYIVNERDPRADYAIHLVHGFLIDKKFLQGVNHTLITDILDTKADFTISGHYHFGFSKQTIEGKTFMNPGAIVRISNSKIEMKRRPKILLIELTKENVEIEEIYLQSARPGEEILDRSEIERHRFKNREMMYFKETIASSNEFNRFNISDIITDIATSNDVNQAVREEAMNRIAMAQVEESSLSS